MAEVSPAWHLLPLSLSALSSLGLCVMRSVLTSAVDTTSSSNVDSDSGPNSPPGSSQGSGSGSGETGGTPQKEVGPCPFYPHPLPSHVPPPSSGAFQEPAATFPLQMMSKMMQSMPNISIGQPRDKSKAGAADAGPVSGPLPFRLSPASSSSEGCL